MTPFAEWMTKQMERRRMNQSQVATYIGLRPSGVNAWFTRDTIPTPATCAKLAELFHVTIDEVLAVAGHLAPQAPLRVVPPSGSRPAVSELERFPNRPSLTDSYEMHMRLRGLRPDSIRTFQFSVRHWNKWAAETDGPPLEAATRDDIRRWVDYQVQTGAAVSSISTRVGMVKVFLRWLLDEGEITEDPTQRIETPRGDEPVADLVTPDEMRATMKALTKAKAYRDLALVSLLYDTGMRVGELVAAVRQDIDWRAGTLTIRAENAKGRRPRVVALSPECLTHLDRYMRHRRDNWDRLLVGKRGPMTTGGVYTVVRGLFEWTGKKVGPHDLRHTNSSELALNGASEADRMTLLGHKSPQMARRYSRQVAAELAIEAHRQASPLARLGR